MISLAFLEAFGQVVISGVLVGSVYALLGCGLNLIWGVMGVINLAHGELMMLGAYVTFWLFTLLGVNPLLSLLASVPGLVLLGSLIQRHLVERLVEELEMASLIATYGLSFLLANLALLAWRGEYRLVRYLTRSLVLGPWRFPQARVVAFASALAIALGFFLFLRRSRLGKAIRALSQDPNLAQVCGVDVSWVRVVAFGLGAGLAGAAGSLQSTIFAFNPEVGQIYILKSVAIIVLGGPGNFVGALLAGLLIGVAEQVTSFLAGAQLSQVVAYLLLILVLLVRPRGLLQAGA